MLGLADHADGVVPGLGDQPAELPGDLSVAACDDDAHDSTVSRSARRAPTSRALACSPCPSPWSPTRPRRCRPRRSAERGHHGGPAAGGDRRDVVRRGRRRGEGVTPQMLAEALQEWTPVSTSRPNPDAMLQIYEKLAAEGAEEIVSVHLSGELSGTFESAQLAASRSPVPVTPVDSRQVGMGTGFAVLAAADALDAGADAAAAAEAARTRAAARRRCSTSTPWSTSAAVVGWAPRRPRRLGARGQADPQGRGRPRRPLREGAHRGQGAVPAGGAGRRGGR